MPDVGECVGVQENTTEDQNLPELTSEKPETAAKNAKSNDLALTAAECIGLVGTMAESCGTSEAAGALKLTSHAKSVNKSRRISKKTTEKPSVSSTPTKPNATWVLWVINDLHGHIDGIPTDRGKRMGGITTLAQTLASIQPALEKSGWPPHYVPPVGFVVCLLGDILRHWTSRCLDKSTAPGVWKLIIDKLCEKQGRSLAYVFGNHEFDFGIPAFEKIAAIKPECGCSRNIEWQGKKRSPGIASPKCPETKGVVPEFAMHVTPPCSESGSKLRFVGITHHPGGPGYGPYLVNNADAFAKSPFQNRCLSRSMACIGTDLGTFLIHLAHYSEHTPDNFGKYWGTQKKRPDIILKGHDHTPVDPKRGTVPSTGPVPTFEAAVDGAGFGELRLEFYDDRVEYQWIPVTLGLASGSPLVLTPSPPPSYTPFLKGVKFRRMGGSEGDANLLYRAVCLLLKSMSHYCADSKPHLVIASPRSIRTHCFVPATEPDGTVIDEFDLRNVFGAGPISTTTYPIADVRTGLANSLKNPRLLESVLPDYFGNRSLDVELYSPYLFEGGEVPCARVICFLFNDTIYLLTPDLLHKRRANLYTLGGTGASPFERRFYSSGEVSTVLGKLLSDSVGSVGVTADRFTRDLCEWELAPPGGEHVWRVVGNYLTHLQNTGVTELRFS